MHCMFRTPSYVVLTDSKRWMVLPEDGDERQKASECRSHNRNSVYGRQYIKCWLNEVGIQLQSNMPNESLTLFLLCSYGLNEHSWFEGH
jgi:hypothetical protein